MNQYIGVKMFFLKLAGVDSNFLQSDEFVSSEEVTIGRSIGFLIFLIVLINFICSFFIFADIFVELRESISDYFYYPFFIFPLSIFYSFIMFSLIKFSMIIGHLGDLEPVKRIQKILGTLPVLFALSLLGVVASVPLQVSALGNDLRIAEILHHWDSLENNILSIDLSFASEGSPDSHGCLKPFLSPNIFANPSESIDKLAECRDIYTINLQNENARLSYSKTIDAALRSQLYMDGLIARSAYGWNKEPIASYFITSLMVLLFNSPLLIKLFSSKRASEYWQDDFHRYLLAVNSNIEVDAHVVFDASGEMKGIHRFYDDERLQEIVHNFFSKNKKKSESELNNY
jgi:hypothetical protein